VSRFHSHIQTGGISLKFMTHDKAHRHNLQR